MAQCPFNKRCILLMMKIMNFSRIFWSFGIAFVCGVIFQLIQMILFDIFGIDRIIGIFMVPSLIIMPVFVSVIISNFYHKNRTYVIITGIMTLFFAIIALNMYLIGCAIGMTRFG